MYSMDLRGGGGLGGGGGRRGGRGDGGHPGLHVGFSNNNDNDRKAIVGL